CIFAGNADVPSAVSEKREIILPFEQYFGRGVADGDVRAPCIRGGGSFQLASVPAQLKSI
ncbi:MAG TPA: hypothetical protein VNG94_04295, partial [Pyrinomonadaceae bacterium]|nr:hypothetical protein [Pyrinomonadaceae bacterium]